MSNRLFSTLVCLALMTTPAITIAADSNQFGPSNPFYSSSQLPYQTIPWDKIKDGDYRPAIEAGMAEQLKDIQAIAIDPAPPTFENTIVAMEKSGQLLTRAASAFFAVTGANTNDKLQKVRSIEAPKLAAHRDAIFLDGKLFARVNTLYKQRESLKLDAESQKLLKFYYDQFVHAGANLSDADKEKLKKMNEEDASLSDAFSTKLLAATKDGAFVTKDKAALAG